MVTEAELLAGDVSAEVSGDALGPDKREDVRVIVVREFEKSGDESHATGFGCIRLEGPVATIWK